jgi:hypothetical protein
LRPIGQRHVEEAQFSIRYRQADLGIVDGIDTPERRTAIDELSDVDRLVAHASRIGRLQLGASQISARVLERDPGLSKHGLADAMSVLGIIDARFTRDVASSEAALTIELLARTRLFALGASEAGARSFDGGTIVGGVDADERIALLEESSGNEGRRDPDDLAGDLRNQLALGARNHGPLSLDGETHWLEAQGHHANERSGDRGRLCLGLRCTCEQQCDPDRPDAEKSDGKPDLEPVLHHLGPLPVGSDLALGGDGAGTRCGMGNQGLKQRLVRGFPLLRIGLEQPGQVVVQLA